MSEFLVAGHSHIFAMGAPFNYKGPRALMPTDFNGQQGFFFLDNDAWPVTTAYFDELVEHGAGRDVIVVWGGNQHILSFLFEPEIRFDFFETPQASVSKDGVAILPKRVVRAHEEQFIFPLRGVLKALKKTAKSIRVLGTLPPRPDIEERFGDSIRQTSGWREVAESHGISIDTAAITPAGLIKKVWLVSQEMLSEAASEAGAAFVPVPPSAFDDAGFLAKRFWIESDFTHGNAEYGALMLETALQTPAVPKLRPENVAKAASSHPYRSLPSGAFWKTAVSENFDAASLTRGEPLIRAGERLASAGSCFAANIVPYLEGAGISYVRTEHVPAQFRRFVEADNFSYAKFSASYGNIYTARQALQLLQRVLGRFQPVEDRWRRDDGAVVDPYRPGLIHPALNDAEFDALLSQHLRNVLEVFRQADVFVFTLGLTEAWVSKADGAVFPACPGTVAGQFDPERHAFKNFTAAEVTADLSAFIELARKINPTIRFILTVSPVPLVATATDSHVLVATTYSKSVLRVAAEEAVTRHEGVVYFPAYEIVTGPQAPQDFFEDDRREPSEKAIRTVMQSFLSRCEVETSTVQPLEKAAPAIEKTGAMRLSEAIADALCEEAAVQH